LRSAGKFDRVRAIILGTFKNCNKGNFNIKEEDSLSLNQIFEHTFKNLNIPVISGFSFGHVEDQAIFPTGVEAEFDTEHSEIRIKRKVLRDFF
jgi:muramoyltetrapeptide carboxypeptidase